MKKLFQKLLGKLIKKAVNKAVSNNEVEVPEMEPMAPEVEPLTALGATSCMSHI